MNFRTIDVASIKIANNRPFVFIGGPCVIESYEKTYYIAEEIQKICNTLKIDFILKSSFDKANRTNIKSERGVGLQYGIEILSEISKKLSIPVLTDVHLPEQCDIVAKYVDVLQIPAFLCRQTDLLQAAARTGKPINIKKGQFVAPWDMKSVVAKIEACDNYSIMLCDRGTCFGYNTLVSDFRGLPIMASTGYPVVFDATHSVQKPSAGGERIFAPILARAAVAVGVAGVFMEVHDDPDNAPCDGPNMIRLCDLKQILTELKQIDNISKQYIRTIE